MVAEGKIVSNYPRDFDESVEIQRQIGFALADVFVSFRSCIWMPTGTILAAFVVFWLLNILGAVLALAFAFGFMYTFSVGLIAILELAKLRTWVRGRTLLMIPVLLVCSVPVIGIIPSIFISRHLFSQLRDFGVHSNPRQFREELTEAISKWGSAAS